MPTVGLFVDEVGKFITQANDYFFPPALSIIYGFVLLNAIVYLTFRRPHKKDPRTAMYWVLEGLQNALDGKLDTVEAAQIEAQLAIARRSERAEIVALANAIGAYLIMEKGHLSATAPGIWKRIVTWVHAVGTRLGRRIHRATISALLILWVVFVIGYIVLVAQGASNLSSQVVQWRDVLIAIQVVVGGVMILALIAWPTKNEERGLKFAAGGFLFSSVALQTLYFYIS